MTEPRNYLVEADAFVAAEGNRGEAAEGRASPPHRGRRAGHVSNGFPGNLGGPDASELEQ